MALMQCPSVPSAPTLMGHFYACIAILQPPHTMRRYKIWCWRPLQINHASLGQEDSENLGGYFLSIDIYIYLRLSDGRPDMLHLCSIPFPFLILTQLFEAPTYCGEGIDHREHKFHFRSTFHYDMSSNMLHLDHNSSMLLQWRIHLGCHHSNPEI